MMTPHYADDVVTLYHGDCLDVLKTLPDRSVDSVVTDPPYGLEFMGKEWDAFRPSTTANRGGRAPGRSVEEAGRWVAVEYGTTKRRSTLTCDACGKSDKFTKPHGCPDGAGWTRVYLDNSAHNAATMQAFGAWCELWARECLRVLKPGGHLLAFGGTRTAHRLASAIEDAGFELRDTIAWLYGSGFPKSLDVSKAIDKAAGVERDRFDRPAFGGTFSDDGGTTYGTVLSASPVTPEAGRWAGWGTALKPAHEPIVVARKPLAGTVEGNVRTHGTGALNIDDCRTGADGGCTGAGRGPRGDVYGDGLNGTFAPPVPGLGRWPTNVALDPDVAAELDAQTGTLTSGANPTRRGADKFRDAYGDFRGQESCDPARGADSGGASRFFPVFSPYWRGETCCMCNGTGRDFSFVTEPEADGIERVIGRVENGRACRACNGHGRDPSDMPTFRYEAKAPTDERPRVGELAHPTVKPLDLMRWLVRLVTPPGGLVLEPFAGSGTTAEACIVEGFRCIAIEREADYLPLILARITKPIEPVMFGMEAS